MNSATISVIIPCYNSENTIVSCIKSILNQSDPIDEIIIVDDGSTDNSVDVVKEFFKTIEEAPIKVNLHEQKNSGPSAARNKGVQLSTSSYVAFLDSDDEWFVDHISIIKTFFKQKPDCKMAATKYLSMPIIFSGEVSFKRMIFKNHFFTPCIVMKKQMFIENNGFNENMKHAEDYDLWLNIVSSNKAYLLDYYGAGNIIGKKPFGDQGLSSNLLEMHKGVLDCYNNLYSQKKLDFVTCFMAKQLERVKYFRRIVLSLKNKKM